MNTAFLRLGTNDLVKGLVVAVLGAFLGAIIQGLETKGLNFASYDWVSIFNLAWQVALAYLGKNLLTSENGKVLGHI